MGAYPYSSIPIPVPSGMGFKNGGLVSFADGGNTSVPYYLARPNAPSAPSDPLGLLGGNSAPHTLKVGNAYYQWDPTTGSWQPLDLTGGGTSGGTATQNYHLNPQEIQLQYDQLYQTALQRGATEEDARRQALAGLIENRNSQQINLGQAYGDIASKAAAFAQKPTDAVADLMYRNAMFGQGQGGSPYGATNNASMRQMQGALGDKFQQMFGPAADALRQAQGFLLSPPPSEFLSPDTRSQLGLNPGQTFPTTQWSGSPPPGTMNPAATSGTSQPPTTATTGMGAMGGMANGGGAVVNQGFMGVPLTSGFAQGGAASVQPYGLSPASGAPNTSAGLQGFADGALVSFMPVSMSKGGVIGGGSGSTGADIGFSNFGTVSSSGGMGMAYGGRVGVRPPPMPAEGGLSLNLSEPAKIVGIHSGHVYATVAEPRPDGTPRPERLEIKPLKSELAKDKQLEAQNKQTAMTPQETLATGQPSGGQPAAPGNPQGQMAGGQMTGMNSYAQGGGITFGQSPSDLYGALRSNLASQGVQTPTGSQLPDLRMLSGDFYTNFNRQSPQYQGEVESGYNAMFPNIDFTHDLNQYTPQAPVQSFFRPQVSFA